jgi:hypothetical protein
MKCSVLIAFALAIPAFAAPPNETDYPTQYSVMNTIKVGGFMIGKFCTMTLRDQANPSIAFVVQRKGYGGCHVWDSGTIFHGRREKNSIKILAKDDKGELKVEELAGRFYCITGHVCSVVIRTLRSPNSSGRVLV